MSQVTIWQDTCPKVLVLLGSNATSTLEQSAKIVRDAIRHLAALGLRITHIGDYYSTACFPVGAGPDFVNVAIGLDSDLAAKDLLALFHQVEDAFGRERPSRWAQRTLDIDLVAYESRVLPDAEVLRQWMDLPLEDQKRIAPDQLVLPHPRMHERAFVLIPLADVAPDWIHPITGKTVREMAHDLPEAEKKGVIAIPSS